MTKTLRKPVAFISAAVMFMTMLLYFPSGIFSNMDWGLSASAANTITPEEPSIDGGVYQIGTAEELYWFAALVNGDTAVSGVTAANTAAKAVLTGDIIVNPSIEWTPIGNDLNPYIGTFDGQNHIVSGLYFNNSNKYNVGLFGCVGSGGSVSNVGVMDSYFKAKNNVGGVCGNNSGTIANCYNTGEVSATDDKVGGVCGDNEKGTITNCYNTGTVSGTNNVGGVCGLNYDGTITNCYNTGNVTGTGTGTYVGGVCGCNYAYDKTAEITNCYNTGNVSGQSDVGGVCGGNNGTITNCYNTGNVTAPDCYPCVGGVCGSNYAGEITNCYYLSDTATGGIQGTDETGSAESKTTAQFKSGEVAYLLSQGSSGLYWIQPASEDYPVLSKIGLKQPAISDSVYQIGTAEELYWFAALVKGDKRVSKEAEGQNTAANAVLTDNITVNSNLLSSLEYDAKGNVANDTDFTSWMPIGGCYTETIAVEYTGTFDGKGFTVSGLYFNDTVYKTGRYVGLFGYVGSGGKVSNVGVVDSYFNGNMFVGGVCGWNKGTIENCYNTGNVKALCYVGGVCGKNLAISSTATITNCYNTGNVTATGNGDDVFGVNVGGVCGDNSALLGYTATIANCYSTGAVSGSGQVGGVCGQNYVSNGGTATIANCYYNSTVYSGNAIGINDGGTSGTDVLGKTTARFNIGEVAYLLQGSQTVAVWGQQIDTDNYPVLGGAKVYQNVSYEQCVGEPGDPTYSYENTQKAPVYQEHSYVDGVCEWCGEPEACQHVAGTSVKTNVVAPTCTYYGSYTKVTYCAKCKEEMRRKIYYTMPTGHDCTSGGICKTCGALANGRDGFKSASLTLTDGVILNYYLLLSNEALADKNAYIHFTSPQGVDMKIMLSDGVEDSGRYKFSLELRPDQMADEITAQVVYSDDVQGNSINYSVQTYLDNADSSVSALANAMQNFGAFTQLYTGRNTDNLAADVTDYTVNASIGDEYKHQLSGNASGITVKGATLQIGAYTTIRVKYQLAQGEDISKYTFKCGDTVLEPEKSGDYYYVYLRNIRPQNLDEMYSFTVTDGTNTTTLKYSAFSYMKNILDNADKYDKNIVNLMNAMYDYNKAADAYNN